MASSPITTWQIEGGKVEVVTDFLFLGSKITVDGDCSHEIRRRLLLGRKVMKNWTVCWKSETLSCQQRSVWSRLQSSQWPHVAVRAGQWRRQNAKELMLLNCVLKKIPESPLESKEIKPANLKGDQPWIFTGRTGAEAEAPVFWSSDAGDSWEKFLMLAETEGRRKRGLQRMRWLDGITDTMSMNLGKLQAMVRNREAWHATVHKS